IGHNKFLVYVDRKGDPQAVLLGSTNWTSTGLSTQTNNTIVVEDPKLAARYLAYWKQLVADTKSAKGVAKALQGKVLRGWDAAEKDFTLSGGSSLESWFSPNTAKARGKRAGEKRPADMEAL